MEVQVRKRNGDLVSFDIYRIVKAINQAMIEVDGQLYETETSWDIAHEVFNQFQNNQLVDVEAIQNYVEIALMKSERPDVARAYVRYRYKREIARECRADFLNAIEDKLAAKAVVNQNANVDEHSFGGRIGEASGVMMRQYALDKLISPMARKNHVENMIYIHDLDHYAIGDHNCLTIPFDDLLAKGFNTRQTDVRPANSINTAMQLIAVIFQLQSLQQFGGVSASHLDWTMVPYVRKSFWKHFKDGMIYIEEQPWDLMPDNSGRSIEDEIYKNWPNVYKYAMEMTERELNQAVEGMYHNLK